MILNKKNMRNKKSYPNSMSAGAGQWLCASSEVEGRAE